MPKIKTHRGAAKRFHVTSTKKIQKRTASSSHLLEKKSAKRKRKFKTMGGLGSGDEKNIKKMLNI